MVKNSSSFAVNSGEAYMLKTGNGKYLIDKCKVTTQSDKDNK